MRTKKIQAMTMFFAVSFSLLCAQSPQSYKIFNAQGNEVSYAQMIKDLASKRVIFFGEMHNCPISHWLELKVTESLHTIHKNQLTLGAEMFETDNQLILDEFLSGTISEKSYEAEMRLWQNYATDYAPLVDFAKEHRLTFVATNVPRRYARLVSRKGLEALQALSENAKQFMAPLPIPYKADTEQNATFEQMTAMMGYTDRNPEFMAQAQALKDATMAWSIARHVNTQKGCFLHFNGTFHSDKGEGIIPFLQHYKKEVSVGVIATCRQEKIDKMDEVNALRADYIICIPEDMTHSY